MKRSKAEIEKFQNIISQFGFSPLNKGLNRYSANKGSVEQIESLIKVFSSYQDNAKELAMMIMDGVANGNHYSCTVYSALIIANDTCIPKGLGVKNLKLKTDHVPFLKSYYRKFFKFQKMSSGEALAVIKSRFDVVSPETIKKYRLAINAIDAQRI
jgi:hypothetical protein